MKLVGDLAVKPSKPPVRQCEEAGWSSEVGGAGLRGGDDAGW